MTQSLKQNMNYLTIKLASEITKPLTEEEKKFLVKTPGYHSGKDIYITQDGAQSITGVCPEDDDGNAASHSTAQVVKLTSDQKNQVHADTLKYLESGDEHGLRETWHGFDADQKAVLWAMFNSQQRSSIKKMMG